MTLKETYEEMSDEELLEKYRTLQDYREKPKIIILEELRKRKLVSEEEVEKKLKRIEELERISEKKEIKNKKVNNSWAAQYGATRFIALFLMGGLFLCTLSIFDFLSGFYSLFWKETDARIVELIKRVEIVKTNRNHVESTHERYVGDIMYSYIIGDERYTNSKINYNNEGEIREKSTLLESKVKGDILKIQYNPKNPKESVVIGFSIKFFFMKFIFGLILLKLAFSFIEKSKKDNLNLVFTKKIFKIGVVIELFICIMLLWSFI